MAVLQAYISIPVASRGADQFSELVPITRNGAPVKVGDILAGDEAHQRGLVDHEDDSFDQFPQEKFGYLVSMGDVEVYRAKVKQHRHMITKNGKPTPLSRRKAAVNAAQTVVDVLKEAGMVKIAFCGSTITIGQNALSPRDLYLEGLRLNQRKGKSYVVQLAIATPAPAGPPPSLGIASGDQNALIPTGSIHQSAPPGTSLSPNNLSNPTTSSSPGPASTSSGGPTRQLSARLRAQPYSPIPRRGQAMLSGTRTLTTGSLPSRPMMGVTPSPLSTGLSTLIAPPSLSFSEVAAGLREVLSGSSGRYSPEMHHAYDLAHPAGELGAQEPAPPLSASPEPVWSPYGGHRSDNLMVSSPQSTLFSTSSPVLSPASSPDIESNYTYSSVPDTLHAFGSAASVPRSMTYPSYSAHPSDGPSYWNTGSRGCFQG